MLGGLVILIAGAEFLVRSSVGTALRFGLTLFLLPILRSGYIVSRIEGGVLLTIYIVYTAYLVLVTT